MTVQQLQDYCLSFPHTEETFPFDQNTMVYKVAGKMFVLTSLSEWEEGRPAVNVKSEPLQALELREAYDGIQPGFHMNKTHWNTVHLQADVPDEMVKSLIHTSYTLIVNALPKKIRSALFI